MAFQSFRIVELTVTLQSEIGINEKSSPVRALTLGLENFFKKYKPQMGIKTVTQSSCYDIHYKFEEELATGTFSKVFK